MKAFNKFPSIRLKIKFVSYLIKNTEKKNNENNDKALFAIPHSVDILGGYYSVYESTYFVRILQCL